MSNEHGPGMSVSAERQPGERSTRGACDREPSLLVNAYSDLRQSRPVGHVIIKERGVQGVDGDSWTRRRRGGRKRRRHASRRVTPSPTRRRSAWSARALPPATITTATSPAAAFKRAFSFFCILIDLCERGRAWPARLRSGAAASAHTSKSFRALKRSSKPVCCLQINIRCLKLKRSSLRGTYHVLKTC